MSVYYRDQAKTARRMTALILFMIGVLLTVALYYVKTRAQSAKAEVKSLERQVEIEVAALNVLNAEIAHLENPERLRKLASVQLGLTTVTAEQNKSAADITQIPLRNEPELEE